MQQLSLIPVCEIHGCEKAWRRNKGKKAGGQWKCKECQKVLHAQWKARPGNRAKYEEQKRDWALANPEKEQASKRKSAAKRVEAERERCARKREANKPRYAYLQRRRTARRFECSVALDQVDRQIADAFYAKAEMTGMTVDHIQPLSLQGDHAPWNFELLPLSENSSKSARRPTLKEVMRGERRYRLLRRMFENAATVGAAA